MIFDKFFDSAYDVASRYVTLWRICCFLLAMLLGAEDFYRLISTEFWAAPAVDLGESLISTITKSPLWFFTLVMVMAFYAVPLLAKLAVLRVLKAELKSVHVSKLIETVDSAVSSMPLEIIGDELALARKNAELAEGRIFKYKSFVEIFTFWVCYGLLLLLLGKASVYVFFVSLSWPVLCWRIVPCFLNDYIRFIYYYKQLAIRVGKGVL